MEEELVVRVSDGKVLYNVIHVGPERVVVDERFFKAIEQAGKKYEDEFMERFSPRTATPKE